MRSIMADNFAASGGGVLSPALYSGDATDRRHNSERARAGQHHAEPALNRPAMPDQLARKAHDRTRADRRCAEKSERCEGLFRHAGQGGGKRLIVSYPCRSAWREAASHDG